MDEQDGPQNMDVDVDPEFQAALLASMQDVAGLGGQQPGGQQPGPVPVPPQSVGQGQAPQGQLLFGPMFPQNMAPPQPPQPQSVLGPTAAQNAGQGLGGITQAQLAQILAGIGQGAGPTAAPAQAQDAAGPPVAPGMMHFVPAPAADSQAAAAPMAVDAQAAQHSWTSQLFGWLPARQSGPNYPPIAVQTGQEAALASALCEALGVEITVLPNTGVAATGSVRAKPSITLSTSPSSSGSEFELSDANLDSTVRSRMQRPHLPPGISKLAVLGDCFRRAEAAAAQQPDPSVQAGVSRLGQRLASAALDLLAADDGEDLFFEGGQATQLLFAAILEGHVRESFLEAMIQQTGTPERGEVWLRLLRRATSVVAETPLTELPSKWGSRLYVLSVLMSIRPLQHLLASLLVDEALNAELKSGPMFEKDSPLGALLAVTSLPDYLASLHRNQTLSPARDSFMQLRGYPNRQGDIEAARRGLTVIFQQVYDITFEICNRVVRLKGVEPSGMPKEAVVGWLAACAGAGEARASEGEKGVFKAIAVQGGCSDGFAVGATALALRFCRPFLSGEEKFLERLEPGYYEEAMFRVPGCHRELTLAGRPPDDGSRDFTGQAFVAEDLSTVPHFVADCFFVTQRLFHTGLIPTVCRYFEAVEHMMRKRRATDRGQGTPVEVTLMMDCTFAQLLDPKFAADAVKFVNLEALWLLRLMRRPDAEACAAFARIPESVVKDMAMWLSFVIHAGHADQVAGIPLGSLMDCLVGLLLRSDLVRSPLVHSKIVALLQAMLAPHLDPRRQRPGSSLGPQAMRPGEQALVATVLGTGAAQQDLVPALMRVYAAADNVVGLDVDRDKFDKFSFRAHIDSLLMTLWLDPGCFAVTTRMAEQAQRTGNAEVFSDYVGAVLNSLIYLLQDCLDRLQSIYDLEQSKKDEAAWNSLPAGEREAKEQFAASQGQVTRGFMRMAVCSLDVLKRLTSDNNIKQAFLHEPLRARAAYASTSFINTLVGPRVAGLQVDKPGQYNLYPARLLLSMLEFMLRLAEAPSFCEAVAAEADYSDEVMQAARTRLLEEKLGEYGVVERLETLIKQVDALKAPRRTAGAGALSGAEDRGPLSLPYAESPQLAADYTDQLASLQIDEFDASLPQAYSSVYARVAQEAAGDAKKKMRRLNNELKQLSKGDSSLPLSPAAAIFIRFQGDRPDKMRALITGPEDTPYFGGCFVFDIFFPPEYPDVPPLMTLETTGAGRARFNPNLYADGKVCLSLLGTWHGTSESEKWHPDNANLWRILISIQGMILISDPYFNEPAYEGVRGTAEGDRLSRRYNLDLVLHTIRFAMNDKLRSPPPGFEEVIRRHFKLQAHRILSASARWTAEAKEAKMDEQYQRRLMEEIDVLHSLLTAL